MRIAYVINSVEGGGAASPVPTITSVLRANGATVKVFALTGRDRRGLPAMIAAGLDVAVRDGGETDHALALRWLAFFVAGEAETRPAFLFGIYLIPIFASIIPIWFIATHRTMELPMSAAERTLELARRIAGAITPRKRTTIARGA